MRLATLQFAPKLGDVQGNLKRADELLGRDEDEASLKALDLLVLPELAFTGYNHPNLEAIRPYLEPTAAGISAIWAKGTARRLGCIVAVGYPEKAVSATTGEEKMYNSLVFVSPSGEVLAHYRKTFLYYTDETWASEGQGFLTVDLPMVGQTSDTLVTPVDDVDEKGGHGTIRITAGICMDINPYRFISPWTAYEFATHTLQARGKLVVLSMAWLTRMSAEELQRATEPDLETFAYWMERMSPLLGADGRDEELVVMFANRAGDEGEAEKIGPVRYAGTSAIVGMSKGEGEVPGEVRIWEILGRGEEGVCVADTEVEARFRLSRRAPSPPEA